MDWRLRMGSAPALRPFLRVAQKAPRREELRGPRTYANAAKSHRELVAGGYTLVSPRHGRNLYRLAERVEQEGIEGAIVDCGVWNGGSTLLMSMAAPTRRAWAFDSFEGMPEPRPELDTEASLEYVGYAKGSEQKLLEGFRRYADADRLTIVKGWFEESLPRTQGEIESIAILHVDADWYESVRLALEAFYPKVSPGGYVLIDDYRTWPGAKLAVDEYRERERISARLVGGHYWQKQAGS